jgi:hypothetical protein
MKDYLTGVRKQFEYYRSLGDLTMSQLSEDELFHQVNSTSNSVAIIVKHLHGNMLSRWTDFLTTDGEKDWRKRDDEFETELKTKEAVFTLWNEGWDCLFSALDQLTEKELDKEIYIRNMRHTVAEAINRQLAHYPYHVGQIVFIGKMFKAENWQSLSIAKGTSKVYNEEKFSKPKRIIHFTDHL